MVRYRLLLVSYEAIYVRDPSTTSAGRFCRLFDNMLYLIVMTSSPATMPHLCFCELRWVWSTSAIAYYHMCVLCWKNVYTTIRPRVNNTPSIIVLEATWCKSVKTRKVEIPYWLVTTSLIMRAAILSLVLRDSISFPTMGWVSSLQLYLFVQYLMFLPHVIAEVIWCFMILILKTAVI
jgi:hypothetical protein